ncbi:MAG: cell division protein FtsW [Chloroflexi bacterium]|nr:cell division protein FtsW [Chloroflexota bacterium]
MGLGTFVKPSTKPATATARRAKPITGDLVLVAIVIALCVFGLLMVFSASTDFSLLEYGKPYFTFNKQVLWMVLGSLIAVAISRLDYHLVRKVAVPMMGVTIVLLIAVLLAGENRLGSIRSFFGGSVQPSELAKLVTIIYLAVWLYSKREHMHNVQLGLLPLAVILGSIGGLIYLQPDLSAAATIFILGGLLFFLAGGDLKQIIIFIVVALAAGWLVVQLSDTGRERLATYIAGLKDPLQSSDHMLYSLESIVNGGFFGVGIGNAALKLEGLPFAATDSIFAVIVEEVGLVGAVMLASLYGVLIWRGVKIAERAPDMLGKVLAGGLTFWIGIEALINMAVLVGLLPFAGNALPFVSAGGSNLISMLTAIGLLVGISRQAGQKSPETVVEQRRSYSASADLRRGNRRRSLPRARRP